MMSSLQCAHDPALEQQQAPSLVPSRGIRQAQSDVEKGGVT
jgi:hypothetical protein